MEMMLWAFGSRQSDLRNQDIVRLCGKRRKLGVTKGWRIRLGVAVVRKDRRGNISFSARFR